ncbi:MAG: PIN domain-containing protein [Verrucomicrobiota bacterium JB024]|nr:PIN domain-containing protein [Verrucomicrobiota bacterium JB024]
MKTNYVLIDFENVQPDDVRSLNLPHVRVMVFVGANQAKVPLLLAAALQPMGERAEYLTISGSGKNALDFHIAYYIGRLAMEDSDAFFHIVSRDTGFDPLIRHLKDHRIWARRSESVAEIPFLSGDTSVVPTDRLKAVIDRLGSMGTSRPRVVRTLRTTINSIFKKKLSDEEIDTLLEDLKARNKIAVEGSKVTYSL